jgi:hypothetical protein
MLDQREWRKSRDADANPLQTSWVVLRLGRSRVPDPSRSPERLAYRWVTWMTASQPGCACR